MKLWIDAHISPGVAAWINENFLHEAQSLRGIGMRDASDLEIFNKAKEENVVLISKESDFVDLIEAHGSPPKLIFLRCGNTTNQRMREIFGVHLESVLKRLACDETIVEIE